MGELTVRLSRTELEQIRAVCSEFFVGRDAQIYLFGSRTDANKKGGDIDLLIVVAAADLKWLELEKLVLVTKLKSKIGDQRIDILVATIDMLTQDPFIKTIVPDLVLLGDY
jgi:predicted nucleotidyltransferase